MTLISQRLILPALTTCSATLLYLLYKRMHDFNDAQRFDTTKSKYRSTKLVYKFIMHKICDNNGLFIKELQDKTNTEFSLEMHTSDEKYYVCTIRGNKRNVDLAMDMLSFMIETQQSKVENEFIFVPYNAFTRIMRRYSEILHEIQARSNVDITLVNDSDPFKFKITGFVEQIREARCQIEEIIEEVRSVQAKKQLSFRNDINSLDTNIFHTLPINHLIEVHICGINTPNEFWVQLPDNDEFANLINMMNDHTYMPLVKSEICPGELVIVKVNNECYRAEIINVLKDDQCYVYYLDMGQCHVVSKTCIFSLPSSMLTVSCQAVQCSLADVIPKNDQWCDEACEKFSELTLTQERKPLIVKVRSYKERFNIYGTACPRKLTVSSVELYNKNDREINIGQALIDLGFAQLEKDDQKGINFTSVFHPCEVPFSSIPASSISNNYAEKNFAPAGYESEDEFSDNSDAELF